MVSKEVHPVMAVASEQLAAPMAASTTGTISADELLGRRQDAFVISFSHQRSFMDSVWSGYIRVHEFYSVEDQTDC
jgi:hypothetical protein